MCFANDTYAQRDQCQVEPVHRRWTCHRERIDIVHLPDGKASVEILMEFDGGDGIVIVTANAQCQSMESIDGLLSGLRSICNPPE